MADIERVGPDPLDWGTVEQQVSYVLPVAMKVHRMPDDPGSLGMFLKVVSGPTDRDAYLAGEPVATLLRFYLPQETALAFIEHLTNSIKKSGHQT